MRKKIVLVAEAMLGGIRQHVCDIIENLDKEEYDICLVYSDLRADGAFYREKEKLGKSARLILLNEMQGSLGKMDFAAYRRLAGILREISPDIVHCHSSKAGIVGRLAARACRVPVIIYTPNAYAFQNPAVTGVKREIYILAEKFLSRAATTMTVNVSKGEMRLAKGYKLDKKEKFALIYNGIPDVALPGKEELRRELGLRQGITYVGVTARCDRQKDPATFLKIAEKAVNHYENVEFVYIGDGALREEMESWARERGLQDRIHMPGFRADASRLVGAFDIYLSTALYEGLPYSMVEAMRAGVPLIATDVVGNNELVSEGKNGMLFPAGDVDAAYGLVRKQVEEHVILERDVKETFMQKFSVDTMMKKLDAVYKSGGGVLR